MITCEECGSELDPDDAYDYGGDCYCWSCYSWIASPNDENDLYWFYEEL